MHRAATIPMAGDVRDLIGPVAERVENRSLLLDKFVFHKQWPVVEEHTRRERDFVEWDEASRWSLMRIADGAAQILHRDAQEKRRKARGHNVEEHNCERYNAEARIAETLANVRWDTRELETLRARHTRRFLGLFRKAYNDRALITIAQLEGRLAINLADSLIQNAGICLDRLFGLPYIPGSAVKGVCRHAALEDLKTASGQQQATLLHVFCAVFGTAENDFTNGELRRFRQFLPENARDQKGAVSFLPAYPVNEAKIVVDLTNVHYPDYYRTGRTEDLSKEQPCPNPFPAVDVGAQFAFCLVLNGINNDQHLLDHARRWLEAALTRRGLGAKTASGYGWFSLKPEVLDQIEQQERQEAEAAAIKAREQQEEAERQRKEQERIASLSPEEKALEVLAKLNEEQFAVFAKTLAEKDEHEQRAFITLLRDNKEKRQRWKTWKKKKPDLANGIREVCKRLNLPDLP